MRGVILLAIFLILIPSISAQEFLEGLSDRTLLIISPLILIGAGLIFFTVIYIKDNYEKIKGLTKAIKIKAEKKVEEKTEINHLKEIRSFEKRLPNLDPELALKELSGHARSFFADKLNLEQQFTFEELKGKVEDKKRWSDFIKKISDLKYSGKSPEKNELASLTNELKGIVKEVSVKERVPVKKKPAISFDFLKSIKKPSIKISAPKIKVPRPKISENILNSITFIENHLRKRIEWIETKSRTAHLNKLLSYATKTRDLEKAKEKYRNYLITYYKLPIKEQEKFSNYLLKLNNKIKELALESERRDMEKISKELNNIDKKSYIVEKKIPISRRLKQITDYAKEVEKSSVHSFLAGKKHLTDKINSFVKEIEELEKSCLHKPSEKEKLVLTSIKRLQRKPVLEHPITGFDIPVMKEKSKFIEHVKEAYSYLKDKEELGLYRLKPKGKYFLNILEKFMKGEVRLEKRESNLLARFKGPIIDKETEMLNLLEDMKKAGLVVVSEPLIEEERMKLKVKPVKPKATKKMKDLVKEEGLLMDKITGVEQVKDLLEDMKKAGLTIVKESLMEGEKIKFKKEKPAKEVTPWPSITRLKPITPGASREMKNLIKEENELISKLAETEKVKMKERPPIERIKVRRIEKFNWEKTLDELKKQKSAEFKNLLKEENQVISKLNRMKFS